MQDLSEFANCLTRMETWFGKNLKEEQTAYMYEELKFIPFTAWFDISKKIIKERQPIPSKFPTTAECLNEWYMWQRNNPHKVVDPNPRTECGECLSKGFLWFKKYNEQVGYKVEYVVRCAKCENWKRQVSEQLLSSATRSQLEAKGYEVWKPYTNVQSDKLKIDEFRVGQKA